MSLTETQMAKIPRYASDEIERLGRELRVAKDLLAALQGGKPTGCFYITHREAACVQHPIPDGATVTFLPDPYNKHEYFEVRLTQEGNLVVFADDGLAALSGASNSMTLKRGVRP